MMFTTNNEAHMTYAQRRKFILRNIRELRFLLAQTYTNATPGTRMLEHTQLARFRRDLVALRQGR